jgi:hypothetical protein
MGIIRNLLHGLVDEYYHSYPGFFKKQRHSKTLDMAFDCEYSFRVRESIPRNYDLDNINL